MKYFIPTISHASIKEFSLLCSQKFSSVKFDFMVGGLNVEGVPVVPLIYCLQGRGQGVMYGPTYCNAIFNFKFSSRIRLAKFPSKSRKSRVEYVEKESGIMKNY